MYLNFTVNRINDLKMKLKSNVKLNDNEKEPFRCNGRCRLITRAIIPISET